VLHSITIDGIVDCTIIKGSFNTEHFTEFIKSLLDHCQLFPSPRSVIVMDNCTIHKVLKVYRIIKE
ncbi:uncharacterized protein FOMMEDRAFT_44505, partial [Fomitiporia mediterranea MF3/22]|uniref:uncharacterized protein n=1 Tax=Fomitiporia mediterranea (strain MF3/22) TaxID=694068 RepID=UPI00044089D0